jgi:putative hydrolase of the HAD superfamily
MAAGMAMEVRAVLLDGMGTLLRLVPPAPALAEELGVDVPTAERAFRAEVEYYVAHHLEGVDASKLADLRRRCAEVLAAEAGVDPGPALAALMDSLQFEPFDDAVPALTELRARGLRTVVVSNWDCSLASVLERVGLRPLVDAAVASAVVGAAKPQRAIFEAGLAAAGCAAAEAVHVGDSVENDVDGARAAGIRAFLLARDGGGDLRTLGELPTLLS